MQVPIVSFLASASCEFTHRYFSACAGRFSRVFVGQSQGWAAASGSSPNADDIYERISELLATESFTIPESIFDEVAETCAALGIPL